MDIVSPMATGNGAYIVHQQLAARIPGYTLIGYDPRRTFFPPLLMPLGRSMRGKDKADILHTTPDYAWFHNGIAKRNVITFHNYVLDQAMRAHSSRIQWLHYRNDLRLFTRRALAMADVVSCVSESTHALLFEDLGWRGPVSVIPNGVDPDRFNPSGKSRSDDDSRLTVLFSGNPNRRKGFHLLSTLAENLPSGIRIVYTGGLNPMKKGHRHESPLQCLGPVEHSDMPEVYQSADLLLVTSFREGHSLAVIEAMASGLPVIAFDVSSLGEQIVHERGGYLVPYGDLDGLRTAIEKLHQEPQTRVAMGEYNRRRASSKFTLKRVAADYMALFRMAA